MASRLRSRRQRGVGRSQESRTLTLNPSREVVAYVEVVDFFRLTGVLRVVDFVEPPLVLLRFAAGDRPDPDLAEEPLLVGLFFAGLFFAELFLAELFLAELFLAELFLAELFFAGLFFAGLFLAELFGADAFLAEVFPDFCRFFAIAVAPPTAVPTATAPAAVSRGFSATADATFLAPDPTTEAAPPAFSVTVSIALFSVSMSTPLAPSLRLNSMSRP